MASTLVWSTETPAPSTFVPDTREYVVCRACGYERPIGEPCGLPCV